MQISEIKFVFKIINMEDKIMKIHNKILIISMMVLMLCCVSAVSAKDIDIDVFDDVVTDEVMVDGVSDIVEDVGIDDASEDVVDEENLREIANINGNTDIYSFFDSNGLLLTNTNDTLTFGGDFYKTNYSFTNFKINRAITINANTSSNPTLHDMGFELLNADGITLNGITFNITAPNTANCYAIDIENASNTNVLNNKITYTCGHDNPANYNYVIKAMNSENLTMFNNTMTAYLPLKTVSWSLQGIAADYVAGVAVEKCNNLNFTKNNLTIIGNARVGGYPTLDAFMIVNSNNSYVGDNIIKENDIISSSTQYSYLYGIDVYQCNDIRINNNTVNMNGNNSATTLPSGNATGAAYCVQLTGNHSGVVVSNNRLTTKNSGPNLGIYSQNYNGHSYINVTGNVINVTGVAGNNPWALVSGMELQDT